MAAHSSKKVVYVALAGNAAIACTKFAAAALTGSSAMLSEGFHSVVDTGNQGLLLLGIRRSGREPTPEHPFGYGRELYFWAFVVAILLFGIGAGLSLYEGMQHLAHPEPVSDPLVNYLVLSLALVFEAGAWWVAFAEFRRIKGDMSYLEAIRRSKDPALFTVLFEDSAAMLGLLIAFAAIALGQATGNPTFDAWGAIAIGVVLAATAALLAYETKGLLIGESAEEQVVAGIRAVVSEDRRVTRTDGVLTMHMGPQDVLLNLNVEFRDGLTTEQVEAAITELEARIRRAYPQVKRISIGAADLSRARGRTAEGGAGAASTRGRGGDPGGQS
jgi:cation diffusion facilitator family transporter